MHTLDCMMDYISDTTTGLVRPEYHAPTLVKLKAKGGIWYVSVTMPKALRKGTKRQEKRSTGTTDERAARTKIVPLTNEIYAKFDRGLAALHISYVQETNQPAFTNTIGDFTKVFTVDPFLIKQHGLDKDPDQKITNLLPGWIAYLEDTNQGDHKERTSRRNKLFEFVSVVGNLHVEDIKKQHGYQYAKWLNDEGKANSTVRSLITKVGAFLTWCEQEDFIDNNPFYNLKLSHYGKESLPYLPFDFDELTAIFAQEMEAANRLCLSILAVTGARLDEIALLDWSQVKTEFGITFIDLRPEEVIVKTDGSHRVVPIHPTVAEDLWSMKTSDGGRIFNYKIDANGKSQNDASKTLMPYVRNVTKHKRKVVHSLRGTFKQMLENAGITQDMIEKLETGEISLAEIDLAIRENKVDKRVNDKITGHSARDTAGKYGYGPLLIPRANAVSKIDVSFQGLQHPDSVR